MYVAYRDREWQSITLQGAQRIGLVWTFAFLLSIFCTTARSEHQAPVTIKLSYGENSYAPYFYFDDNRNPVGVVLDVVRLALSEQHVRFSAVDVPRKRLADAFHSGTIDMDLMKPEWLPKDIPVTFSLPAIPYTETLFVHSEDKRAWNSPDDLQGRFVCAHENYVYGAFDRLAREGKVHAVTSRSEITMMKMLAHRRCDAAIGNRLPFLWLAAHMGYGDVIKPSRIEETFPAVPLVVHRDFAHYLPAINRLIRHPDYRQTLQTLTDTHLQKMKRLAEDSLYEKAGKP